MNMINHPPHYTSSNASCSHCGKPIECIDVTRHMGFNDGNVVKYVWRYALKAGVEDLKKALWYLQDLIARLEPPASMAELTRELEYLYGDVPGGTAVAQGVGRAGAHTHVDVPGGTAVAQGVGRAGAHTHVDIPGGSAGHETIRITEHDRI